MRVALCTPSLDGKVQDEYALSLVQTAMACAKEGIELWPCGARGITVVHDARNHLVARALYEGADKVFFIDSDMSWRAEDFVRLVKSGEPLVAGVYQQRTRYFHGPLTFAAKFEQMPPVVDADGLVRMAGMGTGFMCIDRSVFEKIADAGRAPVYMPKIEALKKDNPSNGMVLHYRHYFSFDWLMQPVDDIVPEYRDIMDAMGYPYETEGGERYVRLQCGEDFTFCNKARDLGFRVVADPKCRLVHYDGTVAHHVAFEDVKWGDNGQVQFRQTRLA
jgi:hypothetical protein